MASGSTHKDAFWIVACSAEAGTRESVYSLLKSRLEQTRLIDAVTVFDVPTKLKYGTLDDLVRLSDDVVKHDQYIEQTCRRFERLGLEIDPNSEFRVIWQRNTLTAEQYLARFVWDEARFPSTRLLKQNIDLIVSNVAKLYDEINMKTMVFNELKTATSTDAKQSGTAVSLINRDLVDVLTPDICDGSGFYSTPTLTTAVAIVPRQEINNFIAKYARWGDKVVPQSHVQYPVQDRDGTGVFSFVLFRSQLDQVKEAARASKIVIKEFQFSPEAYERKAAEKARMLAERQKQESVLSRICLAAFSECFVAWVHVKAIRIFVESVLRWGNSNQFNSFLLKLPKSARESRLRKELEEILSSMSVVGRSYFGTQKGGSKKKEEESNVAAGAEDEETFYPYVSTAITPFVQFVQK